MILGLDAMFSVRSACEMETDDNAGSYLCVSRGQCDVGSVTQMTQYLFPGLRDDVNIANGTNLTIVGVVENDFYSCRIWGPDCNVELPTSVNVRPFGKIPVFFNHVLLSWAGDQVEQ